MELGVKQNVGEDIDHRSNLGSIGSFQSFIMEKRGMQQEQLYWNVKAL
jgi:hypothetical protein